jgi:hypothetical protein
MTPAVLRTAREFAGWVGANSRELAGRVVANSGDSGASNRRREEGQEIPPLFTSTLYGTLLNC